MSISIFVLPAIWQPFIWEISAIEISKKTNASCVTTLKCTTFRPNNTVVNKIFPSLREIIA